MDDFEKNWDKHKTTPVRQFDLFMADILNMLQNNTIEETKHYVRGCREGNRFARECPPIKQVEAEQKGTG